jgi:hypothetical protein
MHHLVEISSIASIMAVARFVWSVVWDITRYRLEQRRKPPATAPSV